MSDDNREFESRVTNFPELELCPKPADPAHISQETASEEIGAALQRIKPANSKGLILRIIDGIKNE